MSALDSFLSGRSVEFGAPTRDSTQNAWPWFAAFIAWPYRYGAVQQPSGFQNQATVDADGPDGILLPAGGSPVEMYVPLARNAAFNLEKIRYTAHYVRQPGDPVWRGSRDILNGQRSLYAAPGTSSALTAQGFQSRSYLDWIEVSVWLGSAGSRDYYGGEQYQAQGGNVGYTPVPVSALQGKDDGPGEVKLRALLAGNTTLCIRAVNNFDRDLRLNGTAFGYQVQEQA